MKNKKKYINVNAHIIKANKRHNKLDPPCRVQEGSKIKYAQEVIINGPSKMIYSPNKPLKCGAKVWIETESEIELIGETND